jgi:hypothetical protein
MLMPVTLNNEDDSTTADSAKGYAGGRQITGSTCTAFFLIHDYTDFPQQKQCNAAASLTCPYSVSIADASPIDASDACKLRAQKWIALAAQHVDRHATNEALLSKHDSYPR